MLIFRKTIMFLIKNPIDHMASHSDDLEYQFTAKHSGFH